jgi:hypothetical protein
MAEQKLRCQGSGRAVRGAACHSPRLRHARCTTCLHAIAPAREGHENAGLSPIMTYRWRGLNAFLFWTAKRLQACEFRVKILRCKCSRNGAGSGGAVTEPDAAVTLHRGGGKDGSGCLGMRRPRPYHVQPSPRRACCRWPVETAMRGCSGAGDTPSNAG